MQQHWAGYGTARSDRLCQRHRRILEGADAAQHRQAALWRHADISGSRTGSCRLSAPERAHRQFHTGQLHLEPYRPFDGDRRATAGSTYTDRPTVIYQPLTGVEFLSRLMPPIPPSSVLFMIQSGYSAELVLPIMLNSINGLTNASIRLKRPADPRFVRLVELMREGQIAGAIQIRIERSKEGAESSLVV